MDGFLLELDNVSFKYPNGPVILQNVSLKIAKGDFVGIIGPNGAGKSTLLKLMLGSLKPTEGKISYYEVEGKHYIRKGRIGYLSQEARNFNPQFPGTVREIVQAQAAACLPRAKRELRMQVKKAIDLVGLGPLLNHPIGQLSGGQQQRALLARTLVTEPDILILDEPLTGIDFQSQQVIWNVLFQLNKHFETTILMVSHNITSLTQNVIKVLLVDNGKVEALTN